MSKKLIYSSIIAIVFLSGCGGSSDGSDTKTDEPSNQNGEVSNKAPIANAGENKTVAINETIRLNGTATDSDGTISSIEWKKASKVLATTLSFSYTPTVVGIDVLTLVLVDDDGVSGSDSVEVIVKRNSSSEEQVIVETNSSSEEQAIVETNSSSEEQAIVETNSSSEEDGDIKTDSFE